MIRPRRILTRAGLAGHRRQAGVVEDLGRALGHHHAQSLAQRPQRRRLEPQPAPWRGPLHNVRDHKPAAIGHRGVEPGHLQRSDQHRALTDGGADRVHRGPWLAIDLLLPGLIAQKTWTILILEFNAGALAIAEAPRLPEQLSRTDLQSHLVIEGVAAHSQSHRKADGSIAPVIAVALAAVAEGVHRRHGAVLVVVTRFDASDGGHQLEGAGRRKSLEGPVEHRRVRPTQGVPLGHGRTGGEDVRIEIGPAGHGADRAGLGIHGHDRPLAHCGQGAFGGPLQLEIEGEAEILAGTGLLIAQHPLHFTGGVHLQLLATPFAAQMRLEGVLDAAATNAVLHPITLGFQPVVFLSGDRTGVAEHVGPEAAVGIGPQIVHIHLGACEGGGLLAETQNLLRAEIARQLDAIALVVMAVTALLIKPGGRDAKHPGQTVAQGRPLGVTHLAGLDVEVVGEPARHQHLAMAIENPASHRLTRNQTDAVLVGPGTVLGPLHQLQPDQTDPHGRGEQHHQRQQNRWLLLHAAVPIGRGKQRHRCQPGVLRRCSSSSSRSAILARVDCRA